MRHIFVCVCVVTWWSNGRLTLWTRVGWWTYAAVVVARRRHALTSIRARIRIARIFILSEILEFYFTFNAYSKKKSHLVERSECCSFDRCIVVDIYNCTSCLPVCIDRHRRTGLVNMDSLAE